MKIDEIFCNDFLPFKLFIHIAIYVYLDNIVQVSFTAKLHLGILCQNWSCIKG